jgi:hypothetical protein
LHTFTISPAGNDFVFELAKRVIEKESLGQTQTEERQAPHASDILAINLDGIGALIASPREINVGGTRN